MIQDKDARIAEAAGIKPSRAYREQISLLRTKLRPVADLLPIVAEELGLEIGESWRIVGVSVPYRFDNQLANGQDAVAGMLSQGRLLKDHLKSLNTHEKLSIAGSRGGRPRKSLGFSETKAIEKLPSPSPLRTQVGTKARAHEHAPTHASARETTPPPEKPATEAKPPSRRGTRIDASRALSDADRAYAAGKGIADISTEYENFRDHWLQSANGNAEKKDWAAAWRTWVRKAVEFKARDAPKLPLEKPKHPQASEWEY